MIQVENIFMKEFSDLEAIPGHNKLFFHFGEQKELDAVIQTRQENNTYTYPLLWYLMPNRLQVKKRFAEGECSFVLAHNTDLNWFNDQRFKNVFNEILQPNFDLVLAKIKKSKNISLLEVGGGYDYDFINYPNYGKPTTFCEDESESINFWDAIQFKVNLSIRNGC